jgi:hypothetical protein
MNEPHTVSTEVVEAARDSLVIGTGKCPQRIRKILLRDLRQIAIKPIERS